MKLGRYGMPRNHAAWRQVNTREPENPQERRYKLPPDYEETMQTAVDNHNQRTQKMIDDARDELRRSKDERIDKQLEEWGF